MAEARFSANILKAARRLSDPRVTAGESDTGHRYTAAILTAYQNDAIKSIVAELIREKGIEVARDLPELIKTSTGLTVTTGAASLPADSAKAVEVYSSTQYYWPIPLNSSPAKAASGSDPFITPSATRPYWYEEGQQIKVLGGATANIYVRYVQAPADLAIAGATEVQLSGLWDTEIVNRMVKFGIADMKGALAVTMQESAG